MSEDFNVKAYQKAGTPERPLTGNAGVKPAIAHPFSALNGARETVSQAEMDALLDHIGGVSQLAVDGNTDMNNAMDMSIFDGIEDIPQDAPPEMPELPPRGIVSETPVRRKPAVQDNGFHMTPHQDDTNEKTPELPEEDQRPASGITSEVLPTVVPAHQRAEPRFGSIVTPENMDKRGAALNYIQAKEEETSDLPEMPAAQQPRPAAAPAEMPRKAPDPTRTGGRIPRPGDDTSEAPAAQEEDFGYSDPGLIENQQYHMSREDGLLARELMQKLNLFMSMAPKFMEGVKIPKIDLAAMASKTELMMNGYEPMASSQVRVPIFIPGTDFAYTVSMGPINYFALNKMIQHINRMQIGEAWIEYYNRLVWSITGSSLIMPKNASGGTEVKASQKAWLSIIPYPALPILEAGTLAHVFPATPKPSHEVTCPFCGRRRIPVMVRPDSITYTPEGKRMSPGYIKRHFANKPELTLKELELRFKNRDNAFDSNDNLASGQYGFKPKAIMLPNSYHIIGLDVPMLIDTMTSWKINNEPIDLSNKDVWSKKDMINTFATIRTFRAAMVNPQTGHVQHSKVDMQEALDKLGKVPPNDIAYLVNEVNQYFGEISFRNQIKHPVCPSCFKQIPPRDITDEGLEVYFFLVQK